jgi:serpin B
MSGRKEGLFDGKSPATRAEVSVILQRMIARYETKGVDVEQRLPEVEGSVSSAIDGINDFSFRLAKKLYDGMEGEGNHSFVASPFSVWVPFIALANATEDSFVEPLFSALGVGGIKLEEMNLFSKEIIDDVLSNTVEEGETSVPIWTMSDMIAVSDRYKLKSDFEEQFSEYFGGEAVSLDFSSKESIDYLNEWASSSTNGRIPSIVSEIDPEQLSIVLNAVYFKSGWRDTFSSDETVEGKFFRSDGKSDNVPFMVDEWREAPYYEDSEVQAIRLDFFGGSEMHIVLPKDKGVGDVLSSLDSEKFGKICEGYNKSLGLLKLPKFNIESSFSDLSSVLSGMGIALFDESDSPLTLLVDEISGFVSSVVQKAMIDVDEEGAVASAVTAVSVGVTSILEEPLPSFEMICDSPFLFVLTQNVDLEDAGKDQIMFMGVVGNVLES